jgi:hypothetical protein
MRHSGRKRMGNYMPEQNPPRCCCRSLQSHRFGTFQKAGGLRGFARVICWRTPHCAGNWIDSAIRIKYRNRRAG